MSIVMFIHKVSTTHSLDCLESVSDFASETIKWLTDNAEYKTWDLEINISDNLKTFIYAFKFKSNETAILFKLKFG